MPNINRFTPRTLVGTILIAGFLAFAAVVILTHANSSEADAIKTGRELDVAIFGRGYFSVRQFQSGKTGYTRQGQFSINANGYLTVGSTRDNWLLDPAIGIPSDYVAINITPTGTVSIQSGMSVAHAGEIQLTGFQNEGGLRELAPGIYEATDEAGIPILTLPGTGGVGFLQQEWLLREDDGERWDWPFAILIVLLLIVTWILIQVRFLRRQFDDLKKED